MRYSLAGVIVEFAVGAVVAEIRRVGRDFN